MAGLNRVQLIGNLVANAVTRLTQTGTPVTSFRIACNERFYSNDKQQERVEFVSLVMWGKRGQALCKYLLKGQQVFVQGRLQSRSYTGQDGVTRYVTEVVVGPSDADFQLLGRPGGQQSPPPSSPSVKGKEEKDEFAASTSSSFGEGGEGEDEEVPF